MLSLSLEKYSLLVKGKCYRILLPGYVDVVGSYGSSVCCETYEMFTGWSNRIITVQRASELFTYASSQALDGDANIESPVTKRAPYLSLLET